MILVVQQRWPVNPIAIRRESTLPKGRILLTFEVLQRAVSDPPDVGDHFRETLLRGYVTLAYQTTAQRLEIFFFSFCFRLLSTAIFREAAASPVAFSGKPSKKIENFPSVLGDFLHPIHLVAPFSSSIPFPSKNR